MPTDAPIERLVVGAMSGTSLDAVDVALVRVTGHGLDLRAEHVRWTSQPLGDLTEELRAIARDPEIPDESHLNVLATALGELHVRAIERLDPPRLDLVVAHGQTILHRPPRSRQLLDPGPLVDRFACPVVTDLRQADLAAGGQGAPITPLADWILFRDPAGPRAVINLGGFANVTILPGATDERSVDGIAGFDVCACNHVLDAVARTKLGVPWDESGRAAAAGATHAATAEALVALLRSQRAAGHSLGTGDELDGWIDRLGGARSGEDLAATAVEAIAECLAEALRTHEVRDVLVAGGGALNRSLLATLRRHLDRPVAPTDSCGVPVASREATAMAVLGAIAEDGLAVTLAQVTGRTGPAVPAGRRSEPHTP